MNNYTSGAMDPATQAQAQAAYYYSQQMQMYQQAQTPQAPGTQSAQQSNGGLYPPGTTPATYPVYGTTTGASQSQTASAGGYAPSAPAGYTAAAQASTAPAYVPPPQQQQQPSNQPVYGTAQAYGGGSSSSSGQQSQQQAQTGAYSQSMASSWMPMQNKNQQGSTTAPSYADGAYDTSSSYTAFDQSTAAAASAATISAAPQVYTTGASPNDPRTKSARQVFVPASKEPAKSLLDMNIPPPGGALFGSPAAAGGRGRGGVGAAAAYPLTGGRPTFQSMGMMGMGGGGYGGYPSYGRPRQPYGRGGGGGGYGNPYGASGYAGGGYGYGPYGYGGADWSPRPRRAAPGAHVYGNRPDMMGGGGIGMMGPPASDMFFPYYGIAELPSYEEEDNEPKKIKVEETRIGDWQPVAKDDEEKQPNAENTDNNDNADKDEKQDGEKQQKQPEEGDKQQEQGAEATKVEAAIKLEVEEANTKGEGDKKEDSVKPEAEQQPQEEEEPETILIPPDMLQPDQCKVCDVQLQGDESNQHYASEDHTKKCTEYVEKLRNERKQQKKAQQQGYYGQVGAYNEVYVAPSKKRQHAFINKKFKFTCFLCKMYFENQDLVNKHVSEDGHRRKVQEAQHHQTYYMMNPYGSAPSAKSSKFFQAGGPKPPQLKLRRGANVEDLYCDLCNKIMNSTSQYEEHFNSKKHKEKAAKYGYQQEGEGEGEPTNSNEATATATTEAGGATDQSEQEGGGVETAPPPPPPADQSETPQGAEQPMEETEQEF